MTGSNELQTQNFIDEREVHGHTKLRNLELKNLLGKARKGLALYNSMLLSGESESETSKVIFDEGMSDG